ncbi:hypothetical protein [Synechococcus sp. RS9916]|uniref:hypothetical protein n=1 Tax=Synechococcus sp. RS9916 TaxID=221359 RepID=UPI001E29E6FB|nr:hypothetical protein [Synechococcus sp. RS9916]
MNSSATPARVALVITMLTLGLGTSPQAARAGLLQPVLQMLRPRLEAELTDTCTSLVGEATGGLEGIETLAKGPCRSAAKPMSECLIREAGRSGRELELLSELIRGTVGDNSTLVIRRCVSSLMGLPADGQGSLEGLLRQLQGERRR